MLAQALNARNLDAAAACFAKDACLLTPDSTAIRGRNRIRAVLVQLIARRTQIEVELSSVLGAADVALVRERWTIGSDGVEGARFEQICSATLVLRLIEGEWRLAIAAPWGSGDQILVRPRGTP